MTTTQFDITSVQAKELFQSGQTAAKQFLDTWDFDAYKKKLRQGTPPGRRAGTIG